MPPADTALLDNPIWNALRTDHAPLALGDERALRYPPDIGPLSGIPDQSDASYASLATLATETPVVLFSVDPIHLPAGWNKIRSGPIVQMLRTPQDGGAQSLQAPSSTGDGAHLVCRLNAADSPGMVALAELTEPGPFRLRTIELGNFYGIFRDGQLVSMAGKRMHLPGFVEVSGVCTHPDARGRGYARRLMSIVIEEIEREGKAAFLHALADNPAVHLYESLGFTVRQRFDFAVVINEA